jgi:hypothetical protein
MPYLRRTVEKQADRLSAAEVAEIFDSEALFAYALGLTNRIPHAEECVLVNPIRARGFMTRFLGQHGLSVVPRNSGEH